MLATLQVGEKPRRKMIYHTINQLRPISLFFLSRRSGSVLTSQLTIWASILLVRYRHITPIPKGISFLSSSTTFFSLFSFINFDLSVAAQSTTKQALRLSTQGMPSMHLITQVVKKVCADLWLPLT